MRSTRIKDNVIVLPTSEGMILIRQKVLGEQDSIILLSLSASEAMIQDLRKVSVVIKKRENEKKRHSRRNIWGK